MILGFGLLLSILSPVFLTPVNLVNLLYQSTILGVFAIGMTFVILTAGIDVSVGALPRAPSTRTRSGPELVIVTSRQSQITSGKRYAAGSWIS